MKCNEKYEQDISSLTDVTSILDTRCEKGLDLHITTNSRSLPFLQVLDLLTCQEKDGWRGKGRCFLLTKLPEKPILFQGTFSLCANAFKGERWELPLPLTPPHQLWKARHPGAWAGAGMSTEQQEFQTGSLTPISLRGELLISLVRRKYFLLEKLCNAPIPIFFLLGCPHRSACGQLWAGAVLLLWLLVLHILLQPEKCPLVCRGYERGCWSLTFASSMLPARSLTLTLYSMEKYGAISRHAVQPVH